jgi:hypothetical protein
MIQNGQKLINNQWTYIDTVLLHDPDHDVRELDEEVILFLDKIIVQTDPGESFYIPHLVLKDPVVLVIEALVQLPQNMDSRPLFVLPLHLSFQVLQDLVPLDFIQTE